MKDDGVKRDRELSPVVKKGPAKTRESLGSFSEEPLPLLPTPLFDFESLHSSPIHLTRWTPSTTSTRWTRSSARFASTTTSPSSSPSVSTRCSSALTDGKFQLLKLSPFSDLPVQPHRVAVLPLPKPLPEEAQSEVDPLFLAPCPYGCLGEGNCHNKVDTARSCFYGTLNRASLSPCSTASTNIASSASLFVPSVKTCLQPSRDCGSYLR